MIKDARLKEWALPVDLVSFICGACVLVSCWNLTLAVVVTVVTESLMCYGIRDDIKKYNQAAMLFRTGEEVSGIITDTRMLRAIIQLEDGRMFESRELTECPRVGAKCRVFIGDCDSVTLVERGV